MVVDLPNVLPVIGQRYPAERTDGPRKQRTQVGFRENLDVECVRDASLAGLGADQVTVVENHGARALESKHRPHVTHDRGAAFLHQSLWIALAHPPHFSEAA